MLRAIWTTIYTFFFKLIENVFVQLIISVILGGSTFPYIRAYLNSVWIPLSIALLLSMLIFFLQREFIRYHKNKYKPHENGYYIGPKNLHYCGSDKHSNPIVLIPYSGYYLCPSCNASYPREEVLEPTPNPSFEWVTLPSGTQYVKMDIEKFKLKNPVFLNERGEFLCPQRCPWPCLRPSKPNIYGLLECDQDFVLGSNHKHTWDIRSIYNKLVKPSELIPIINEHLSEWLTNNPKPPAKNTE